MTSSGKRSTKIFSQQERKGLRKLGMRKIEKPEQRKKITEHS